MNTIHRLSAAHGERVSMVPSGVSKAEALGYGHLALWGGTERQGTEQDGEMER
jgi:hypothetical protein